MKLLPFEVGPFAARCVVLTDDGGRDAFIVDPGFDVEVVLEAIRRGGLRPSAILLTHAHLDHAYGVAEAKAAFPAARVLLHPADLPLYDNLPAQAAAFGFPPPPVLPPDGFLADGEELPLGGERLLVRHAPGHSPGHVILVSHTAPKVAVVGDVLFAGSVGRTDLWGGCFDTLARSIREVLYVLPGDTRVVPGHGPETTIAAEAAGNPFVPAR